MEEPVTTKRIDRRQALAVLGSVSLGGLLSTCGGDGNGKGGGTTSDGTSSTVQPKTTTSRATAELFDQSSSCSLTPQETEGPYYFDVDSIRSDIRKDREGRLLRLAVRVRDADSCKPIENAVVDIWHCDALGSYSGYESPGGGPPGVGGASGPADDETYLRGAQVTNAEGIVEFKTIYPGWYQGRTVHIHAKVHIDKRTMLTTQLFFDEKVNTVVYSRKPYSEHIGREQFNESDNIFDERLLLTLKREGASYLGLMTFDVESS